MGHDIFGHVARSAVAVFFIVIMTVVGCADPGGGPPSVDTGADAAAADATTDPGATFCLLGHPDCGCTLNGTCNDPAYACIDGLCQLPTEPSCGPAALCTKSIEQCDAQLTQDACEGWYDGAADPDCADMASYVACNCECYQQDACDAYFACGNLCFNDHCK